MTDAMKIATPTLSTGEPSTLGNYRKLCELFGLKEGVAYFDDKIAASSADEPVLADETQMLNVILTLERKRNG